MSGGSPHDCQGAASRLPRLTNQPSPLRVLLAVAGSRPQGPLFRNTPVPVTSSLTLHFLFPQSKEHPLGLQKKPPFIQDLVESLS